MKKDEILAYILKSHGDLIKKSQSKKDYIEISNVVTIIESILAKKKIKTLYWDVLVKEYFDWYKAKYGFEPDFSGSSTKGLKDIVGKLEKLAKENGIEWTADIAVLYLKKLLNAAYDDKWLKDNFLLSNINRQFSKIRANARGERNDKKIGRISADKLKDFLSGK